MGRVIQRLEDQFPVLRSTDGLSSKNDAGVKCVVLDPITQEKCQGLGFISLRKVDIEIGRGRKHAFADGSIDGVAPIQDPGNGGYTYLSGGGNLSQAEFSLP